MLDIANIPSSQNNVQTFAQAGTWATWVKPRKARYIQIFCLGGGAGGGSGNPSNAVSGGGGGGSAGHMRAGFQAILLPDILYAYVARGGSGATGGTGTAGERSFVAITPDTSSVTGILCASSNGTPTGGAQGISTSAGGTGGTGATVATIANARMLHLGVFSASPGSSGATGGTNNNNAGNITPTGIVTGGAGGAGGRIAGGVTGAGPIPTLPGIPQTTSPVNGSGGIVIYKPITAFIGGLGGSRNATGVFSTSGRGGDGAYGCGGGGGGSSNTAVAGQGGRGGDGGGGLIIITTYF